jgi:hypothetical protein
MKNLIKSVFVIMVMTIVWFKPSEVQSQTTYCERMGVTEKETGIVYCIGMGYTTCVVPCSNQ